MEDKLADGGSAARGGWDAKFVDRAGEGLGSQGLARAAAGEQPAGRVAGGGAHAGPMVGVLEEQGGERLRDCRERSAESDGDLIVVAYNVIDGEAHDPLTGWA